MVVLIGESECKITVLVPGPLCPAVGLCIISRAGTINRLIDKSIDFETSS